MDSCHPRGSRDACGNAFNNPSGIHIVNSVSAFSVKEAQSAQGVPASVVTPATKSDEWKAELKSKLTTTLHGRTRAFDNLIDQYVRSRPAEGRKPDLSRLIRGCMAYRERLVLEDILTLGAVTSVCIEGPLDELGLKTLIEAIPDGFSLQTLKLSMMRLDASLVDLLFEALRRMPKLQKLVLYMVGVEGAFPSERSNGPAFEALETVIALTSSDPELDVCPLLLQLLGACQLRSLSIQDYGAITADQHAILAEALGGQTLLNSLKLAGEKPCGTPKQLDCYMPFLCGQAPFTALHLDGCELETSDFNHLLAALRDKPTLTSLSLCHLTFLKGAGSESVQISSLAGMRNLLDLDLGWNPFEDDTLMQLLDALKKEQTCLMFLGLNGNSIGSKTMAATASLLNANRTLRELSFQRAVLPGREGWSADALEKLAQAFEVNTSLQRFRVPWSDIPEAYRPRLEGALKRNRDSFVVNGMWGALNWLRPGFPKDAARHILEQGLTRPDAMSMSSVNVAAWDARR